MRNFAAGDGLDPDECRSVLARAQRQHDLLFADVPYPQPNTRVVRFFPNRVPAKEQNDVNAKIKAVNKTGGADSELHLRQALFASFVANEYWRAAWYFLPSTGLGRGGSKVRSLLRSVGAIISHIDRVAVNGPAGIPPPELCHSPEAIIAATSEFIRFLPRNRAKQRSKGDELDVERVTKSYRPLATKIGACHAKLNAPKVRNRIYVAQALATKSTLGFIARIELETWRDHFRNRDFLKAMLQEFKALLEVAAAIDGRRTNVRAHAHTESVCAPLVEFWTLHHGKPPRVYDHPDCAFVKFALACLPIVGVNLNPSALANLDMDLVRACIRMKNPIYWIAE
ncbi:hypothetical protein [Hyphomicrobium sp.]|uniref:hypothetical protein n=1 Tax=Hyphomicrobium sp. TaxID=82 RepID=UPI000F95B729|nr:hypothetical protein [Hyphomicrobium sp.]RUO97671.1 MAG: hypothetical protein EKK30_12965 [Hyphomicrobium sp.]